MRFLLRVLAIFIAVSALLSMVRRMLAVLASPRAEHPLLSSAGGRLAKDPVCGTYIPVETAIQARNQFFCSEECRGKYLGA